jgi:hypothetical protein
MTTLDVAAINSRLRDFFANGRAEIGLEVGADAGLSPDLYIQCPASLRKAWAYRIVGTGSYARTPQDTTASLTGKQGWTVVTDNDSTTAPRVLIHSGQYYVVPRDTRPATRQAVDDIYVDTHTLDDVRRFVKANAGHIRDAELTVEQKWWVHSTRFWATVTGCVAGSKQCEWVTVPDPTGDLTTEDAVVTRLLDDQDIALTGVAARAASWRKSNHATGGDIAAGFPRRWLSKNGRWPSTGDRAQLQTAQKLATTAFYVATHAAAVHNVLAMMAPSDADHWAEVDPRFGLLMQWDVRESTSIRIAPKTQVAGTAMIVDAYTCLQMVVTSGYFPLLESRAQWQALKGQHDIVAANGIRVASYAGWFLDGHPAGTAKIAFAQKSSVCADLVGELGAVSQTYYKRSTIGMSPALENAMSQLATETAKERWTALARAKAAASNEVVIAAYGKISGASAGSSIQKLLSTDKKEVEEAVAAYNALNKEVTAALGLGDPVELNAETIHTAPVAAMTPDSSSAASAQAT